MDVRPPNPTFSLVPKLFICICRALKLCNSLFECVYLIRLHDEKPYNNRDYNCAYGCRKIPSVVEVEEHPDA